jgi:sulfotransferase family protein
MPEQHEFEGSAMTLKVIGTGLGRTGTMSLKAALEQLGFGPCYHMMEVFPRPQHVGEWAKAARGEAIDWNALFAGFVATVDWPSAHFWRELTRQYPDAKVIHTERDPEVWWKSFSQTIGEALSMGGPPDRKEWSAMVRTIVTEQTFHGDLSKASVLKAYAAHNAEVKRAIPAARRLDYDIDAAPGWEPLCHFLGVAVPATPFPKTNNTAEFRARMISR